MRIKLVGGDLFIGGPNRVVAEIFESSHPDLFVGTP